MEFNLSRAERHYVTRLAFCMVAYIGALCASRAWIGGVAPPSGALLHVATMLPALPMLATLAALGGYLAEETDEGG